MIWLIRTGLVLSVLLALVAGVFYWQKQPSQTTEPPFVLSQEQVVIDGLEPGDYMFAISLTNPANRPRRILGHSYMCGLNGCIGLTNEQMVSIQPGETFSLDVKVKLVNPGPLEVQMTVYLEDNGIREVVIPLRGTCAAPIHDAAPKP